MLPTTIDAWKAVLKTDPTVTPAGRAEIVALVRNHGKDNKPDKAREPDNRIVGRREARDRFFPGKSLRYLDKLAAQGVLRRIVLPGRTRAAGFNVAEIERLITEGATA